MSSAVMFAPSSKPQQVLEQDLQRVRQGVDGAFDGVQAVDLIGLRRRPSVLRAPKLSVIGTSRAKSMGTARIISGEPASRRRARPRRAAREVPPRARSWRRPGNGRRRRARRTGPASASAAADRTSPRTPLAGAHDRAGLIGLPVANLRRAAERRAAPSQPSRRRADPVHVGRDERVLEQQRMLVALHDDELVALGVLALPRTTRSRPVGDAADVQAVALAERVVGEAVVPAALAAEVVDDRRPGDAGRYWRRNSANGRSPMKQMPVLSFFSATGRPALRAISRTSDLSRSPSGNSTSRDPRRRRRAGSSSGPWPGRAP